MSSVTYSQVAFYRFLAFYAFNTGLILSEICPENLFHMKRNNTDTFTSLQKAVVKAPWKMAKAITSDHLVMIVVPVLH